MSLQLGIFHVDVWPDGVRLEDVCAAISAAWLAGQKQLAKDIAREYGLYDQVCLRCASSRISGGPLHVAVEKSTSETEAALMYQLCVDCRFKETFAQTGSMHKTHRTLKR